jgi:hypothetical protein
MASHDPKNRRPLGWDRIRSEHDVANEIVFESVSLQWVQRFLEESPFTDNSSGILTYYVATLTNMMIDLQI